MMHPNHVHPRSKRTAKPLPYKPLHKPFVVLKPGESQARKANTYRGAPDRIAVKPPAAIRIRFNDNSKYTGAHLRKIRRRKGVGRPPVEPSTQIAA